MAKIVLDRKVLTANISITVFTTLQFLYIKKQKLI